MNQTNLKKHSVQTARHDAWGAGCDGWHVVHQPGLSVIQERMPPDTAEARHLHRASSKPFYVLAGSAVLEAAGIEHALNSGEGLEAAPGVPHQLFDIGHRVERPLIVRDGLGSTASTRIVFLNSLFPSTCSAIALPLSANTFVVIWRYQLL